MNRYVYHYCAQYQPDNCRLVYIDGLAQLENRITSHDEYMKLKPAISSEFHHKLTIISLSFIGMEKGI